ncbi:MAG: RNase adapter RapZ [Hyphomicrobium sp.]
MSRSPSLDNRTAAARPRRERKEGRERILLVTGMSGAGKTTTLKALEDLGYEAIDHVPLSLLSRLVRADQAAAQVPVALGIDVRTRDFGVERALSEVERLIEVGLAEVKLVFLDCDDDALRRRYTETRHRHPLAVGRPVTDGITLEREMIAPLRARADLVIDTTTLSPGALKRIVDGHFAVCGEPELSVFVTSFSFRLGLPRDADLVFDVRFLANPHYDPELQPMNGLQAPVARFIRRDEGLKPFMETLAGLMRPLLPRYAAEGKSYLTIAIGCTGGRHRSVFIAEELGRWLQDEGFPVYLHHRDLNRTPT